MLPILLLILIESSSAETRFMGRMFNPPHPGESIREDVLPAWALPYIARVRPCLRKTCLVTKDGYTLIVSFSKEAAIDRRSEASVTLIVGDSSG